jgi:predicted PurR-regulated permease PerM
MRIERQFAFWLAALVVFVLAIALLKGILLPFVTAVVIAYFLNPIADRLQALGVGRLWAATLIVGMVAVTGVLAVMLLGPIFLEQLRQLIAALPSDLDRITTSLEDVARTWLGSNFPAFKASLDRSVADISQNWAGTVAAIIASMWSRGLALVNFLSLMLITPVVIFYLLVDWHPMLERLDATLPRDYAPTIRSLAGEVNSAVAAFIRGQGAICLILGVLYAVGLSWAGIQYGLLVGLSAGLFAFIPIIGWLLGLLLSSGLAIVQFWPQFTPLLKVVGVLAAGIAIDTAVLSPRLVGQKIGLHPVWLIFALFVFSYLFGLVGTMVAVPLAAAIGVLVRFGVKVYLASSLYQGSAKASAGRADPMSVPGTLKDQP